MDREADIRLAREIPEVEQDYDTLADSRETMIRIAMIYSMIHRLKAG